MKRKGSQKLLSATIVLSLAATAMWSSAAQAETNAAQSNLSKDTALVLCGQDPNKFNLGCEAALSDAITGDKGERWYSFEVKLRSDFDLNVSNIPDGTNYDVVVFDGSGNQISSSENTKNSDENITNLVLNPGRYYVRVKAFQGHSDQPYNLNLESHTIPVILIPGIGGSQLMNGDDPVWVSITKMVNEREKQGTPLTDALTLKSTGVGAGVEPKSPGYQITVNDRDHGLAGIGNFIGDIDSVSNWSKDQALSFLHAFNRDDLDGITGGAKWIFARGTVKAKIQESLQDKGQYYDYLIDQLVSTGFNRQVTLFGYPYDWRLDLQQSREGLTGRIQEAMTASGADKVQLVAHSMGGLLAKDYLLNHPEMAQHVDQVITAGTPYLGAPLAAKALLSTGGYNFQIPLLSDQQGQTISANAPAVYQIAPSKLYDELNSNKPIYTLVETDGSQKAYNLSQLQDQYPNGALMNLAQQLHGQWDTNLPADIPHYHLVGQGVNTIGEFTVTHRRTDEVNFYDYRPGMVSGDGTVPQLSAENPGTGNKNIFYSTDSQVDHTGLVQRANPMKKIINLIKGDPNSPVPNITNGPTVTELPRLIAHSYTGSLADFKNLEIVLTNLDGGKTELIKFQPNGDLDELFTQTTYKPHFTELPDGMYNLQYYTLQSGNYTTHFSGEGSLIPVSYELNRDEETDQLYGKLKVSSDGSSNLIQTQVNGDIDFTQGYKHIEGVPIP